MSRDSDCAAKVGCLVGTVGFPLFRVISQRRSTRPRTFYVSPRNLFFNILCTSRETSRLRIRRQPRRCPKRNVERAITRNANLKSQTHCGNMRARHVDIYTHTYTRTYTCKFLNEILRALDGDSPKFGIEWRELCYDCRVVDLLRAAVRQFAKNEKTHGNSATQQTRWQVAGEEFCMTSTKHTTT